MTSSKTLQPTRTRLRRTVAATTAALALPLGLGACGEAAEKAAEQAAEKAIEDANGGDVDIDIDEDGGQVKVESSDGTYVGGGDLPDDYPSEDVPLVGDVQFGSSAATGTGTGWTVSTLYDGDAATAFDAARSALEGAGFTVDGAAGDTYASMRTDRYAVILSAGDGADGTTLSYVVSSNP